MIGCVIAMESEAEILREVAALKNCSRIFGKTVEGGCAFGKEILLTVCGEGKVNAAAGTCAVLAGGADLVLNFGVAGGLSPERTRAGEVYLIEKVVQYDFDLTQLNGLPLGTLPGECQNFLPLFCPETIRLPRRTLGTGDRFNDSPEDHRTLVRLGCDVREMEAGAIAQVLRGLNVPLLSVKAISDVYGSGSTTEQFKENLRFAAGNLKAHLQEIFEGIR